MMKALVNRIILVALSALAVISCHKDPDQNSNHINNHTGASLTISSKSEVRDLGASKYGGMHVVSLGTISGVDENATLALFEQTFSPKGSLENCTTAWITAPENKEKVEALIAEECKQYANMSWEARIKSGSFWITGCCDVVNTTSREMTIEFFEDEGLTYTWRWKKK